MITSISIENFKGIGKRITIPLKPITLLFGPNSAGKSTILHAIHYARELFLRAIADVHRTESGGDFVDLGGLRRLVHGRKWDRQIAIRIDVQLDGEDLPEFSLEGELVDFVDIDIEEVTDAVASGWVELKIGAYSSDPNVVEYCVGINGERIASLQSAPMDRHLRLTNINWHHPIFISDEEREFAEMARHARAIRDAVSLTHEEEAAKAEDILKEAEQEVRGILVDLYERAGETASETSVIQVAISTGQLRRRAVPTWGHLLDIHFSSGDIASEAPAASESEAERNARIKRQLETTERLAHRAAFTQLMSALIVGVGQYICEQLETFRYVGPLRNIPERHRQPAAPVGPSRWATGAAAWDVLNEGTDQLIAAVSDWMWSDERLATGYKVERLRYREISEAMQRRMLAVTPVDDGEPHFAGSEFEELELAVQDSPESSKVVFFDLANNLFLDPADVGVGLSQLLPVVVAILAPESNLITLEQPELHVHPRVQVGLGDLLIEQALGKNGDGRRLMIETHSEHLLLRLLRRIRETTENNLPPGKTALTPSELLPQSRITLRSVVG